MRKPHRQHARQSVRLAAELHAAGLPTDFRIVGDAAVEFTAAADDAGGKKLPSVTLLAYSGGPLDLGGFGGVPVVVELSSLKTSSQTLPLLRDHEPTQIVGHTTSVDIAARVKVTGIISGVGPAAQEILAAAGNGYPWQVSIGGKYGKLQEVTAGQKVSVNGRNFTGPLYIARQALLREISFVAIGADPGTSAKIAASRAGTSHRNQNMKTFVAWLEAKGIVEPDLSAPVKAVLEAQYDAEVQAAADPDPKPTEGDDPPPTGQINAKAEAAKLLAELRATAKAEADRLAAIATHCGDKHPAIKTKAIDENWDATKVELEVLRASRAAGPAIHVGGGELQAAAVECSLARQFRVRDETLARFYDARTLEASHHKSVRGITLRGLVHEVLRAAGQYVPFGRVDNDTIRAAFVADRDLRATGFSTISLSGVLGNTANKVLLESFLAVPSTSQEFCRQDDHSDFKTHTRYRMTGGGMLEKVGPSGELKHTTLTQESYTNRLDTYGKLIALTRQDIINDDLGAFMQIPDLLGRQAALAVEDAVFTLLLSNPSSFFSTGNRNYQEGSSTNLQISSLTTLEQLFLDQVDSDSKPIAATPAILLVPTGLKVLADQLYTERAVNETTTANKPAPANNPHAGKFKPVASPYLNNTSYTGYSTTAFYLFASPNSLPAMSLAYLNGQRTPTIESAETDFNTLGMQWRIYFDFGVGMVDYRGACKSKGAA